MMPQNQWLSTQPPLLWGIWRNIPFALLGLLIIVLFYHSAKKSRDRCLSMDVADHCAELWILSACSIVG